MDWVVRALLTAAVTASVLFVARGLGRKAAGMLAALPIVTAPALMWLADDRGPAFAASASVGSVVASAALAAFAWGYARLRHRGIGMASLCGTALAVAMLVPAHAASADLRWALLLALSSWAAALLGMPRRIARGRDADGHTGSLFATAAVTGLLSASTTAFGPALGSFITGLLASMPVISGAITVVEHAKRGPAAAADFLSGYVGGLLGKIAFGTIFAIGIAPWGALAALVLASLAAAATVTLASAAIAALDASALPPLERHMDARL